MFRCGGDERRWAWVMVMWEVGVVPAGAFGAERGCLRRLVGVGWGPTTPARRCRAKFRPWRCRPMPSGWHRANCGPLPKCGRAEYGENRPMRFPMLCSVGRLGIGCLLCGRRVWPVGGGWGGRVGDQRAQASRPVRRPGPEGPPETAGQEAASRQPPSSVLLSPPTGLPLLMDGRARDWEERHARASRRSGD